jgi:hypothetical protein
VHTGQTRLELLTVCSNCWGARMLCQS